MGVCSTKEAGPGKTAVAVAGILNPRERIDVTLIEKETFSHDSARFRFALPNVTDVLGLPTGQHIFLSAQIDGRLCSRAYTPVSDDSTKGSFEILVKIYRGDEGKGVPPGKLTCHLDGLEVGGVMQVKGPMGHIKYPEAGRLVEKFGQKVKDLRVKHVGMVAGGSGVTPFLQLLHKSAKDDKDDTHFHLLYANHKPEDVWRREELQALGKEFERFHIHFTVSNPDAEWQGETGRVGKEMLAKYMPPPGPDVVVCVCGPLGFVNEACLHNLEALGYEAVLEF